MKLLEGWLRVIEGCFGLMAAFFGLLLAILTAIAVSGIGCVALFLFLAFVAVAILMF